MQRVRVLRAGFINLKGGVVMIEVACLASMVFLGLASLLATFYITFEPDKLGGGIWLSSGFKRFSLGKYFTRLPFE